MGCNLNITVSPPQICILPPSLSPCLPSLSDHHEQPTAKRVCHSLNHHTCHSPDQVRARTSVQGLGRRRRRRRPPLQSVPLLLIPPFSPGTHGSSRAGDHRERRSRDGDHHPRGGADERRGAARARHPPYPAEDSQDRRRPRRRPQESLAEIRRRSTGARWTATRTDHRRRSGLAQDRLPYQGFLPLSFFSLRFSEHR